MHFIHYLFLTFLPIHTFQWCLKTTFAGTNEMNSVGFSPDGTMIITGSKSGRVTIWDSASLKIKHIYHFGTEVYSAKFSKDQQYIAIGGKQDDVQILSSSTMNLLTTIDTDHQ